VDFENLVIHVRRSVVMMVQGAPKTEASAKDVPLDATLAESLLKLRLVGPYNRETDWVFASPTMKGKQPLWPETLWRRYGRPAVKAAKIQKRVGFHTFRHTYTTLLTQNNEEVKVVQELLSVVHCRSVATLSFDIRWSMPEWTPTTVATLPEWPHHYRFVIACHSLNNAHGVGFTLDLRSAALVPFAFRCLQAESLRKTKTKLYLSERLSLHRWQGLRLDRWTRS